mgnify:CR=1 FL=1
MRRKRGSPAVSDAVLQTAAQTHGIDGFRAQHLALAEDVVDEAGAPRRSVLVNAAESPLAWLARRKRRDGRALIEPAQLQAGERLRADFTYAQMGPRVTSSWDFSAVCGRSASAGPREIADRAVAARQRVTRALDAVGPEFAGLLLDVCCFLKGLEDAERERNWPARCGKIVLQLGLDRLARHYGYAAIARGPAHGIMRGSRTAAD